MAWDFPGGPVVMKLTANAGDVFDPWSRETSKTGQLSLPASTAEPMHPRVHIPQENPSQREAWVPQLQGSPCSPELEKACAEKQRAHAAKRRPSAVKKKKKSHLLPGPCTQSVT